MQKKFFLRKAPSNTLIPTLCPSPEPSLFTTCGSCPYEAKKAVIKLRYLPRWARVESLPSNQTCPTREASVLSAALSVQLLAPLSTFSSVVARLSMLTFIIAYMVHRPYHLPLWKVEGSLTMQLLLEFTVISTVIKMSQESENLVIKDILNVTRTYVFKIYVTRRRLLEDSVAAHHIIVQYSNPDMKKKSGCYVTYCKSYKYPC